jgi:hypothetical protein
MRAPTRLRTTEHLTADNNDALAAQTFEGMRHLGGTGPAGTRCCNCLSWTGGGFGRHRLCAKSVVKKPIPGSAHSCKYFEQLSRTN